MTTEDSDDRESERPEGGEGVTPGEAAGAPEGGESAASNDAGSASAGAAPPPAPSRRLPRGCLVALLAPFAFVVLVVLFQAVTWPNVGKLARENPRTTAFIARYERRHPDRRAEWRWVDYAAVSPHLKRAVIVAEDINFFWHAGFDTAEIRRALEEAWEERESPRGASTITQQLAKNLWLSPSRNPLRKVKEAMLTRDLERMLGKRRILELYLNVVEFGPGVYGAEAAARHYFGKGARNLGEQEAALLAAGLSRPSRWHPGVGSRAYARHAARIRERMDRAQFLWKLI